MTRVSDPSHPFRRLAATLDHPLTARWAREGGPWDGPALDEALAGTSAVEDDIAAVAGGLAALGVGPGSTVAWQRPNGWEAVALFRAAWRLGAVAAPIHHLAGPVDVEAMLDRLGAAAFVGAADDVPRGDPVAEAPTEVDPASVAVALGTAGSTGTPKVVLHTHRALLHKARTMATCHELGPTDAVLMPAPMAHISGLLNGVLITAAGVRVVPMAKWNPAEALGIIERERITFMVGPPTFFVSLMDAPGFTPDAVRSLRLVSCGGAGVTPAFVREASAALGCRVKRTYGSTEAPSITTSPATDDPVRAAETEGRAVGEVELRTVDPATLVDVASGEPGELLVRGPELFVGYDDRERTAEAFVGEGWFRTGDLATVDADGWLTIVGRLKDVIIRGGENIATAPIEQVLEAHDAVRQAVVVGEPDDRLGERVCAFVLTDGAAFDLDACRAWFEARGVTRFQWPERVEVVDELPLLPSGKPDKPALRARLAPRS
jgi:cyclohexanecarboxylate-CoA ligase